jgi:eukaryotic-like serine/threonine-protein kinase
VTRLTLLAMDTTLSPPTGQLLDGRYQVEARLAHGGMATVYRGRDVRLDRVVALKIAHAELAADEEFVRRFITEARAVAQLSSSNVVAVFDQGSVGDVHFIAMEYVAGPTLREVLRARGALTVRESLDIIEGVLGGLAAAHRAGIIHRDVKPENVLLGTDGAVKVADFGLARAAVAAARTKTGMIIGTAAYLAPEQVSSSTSDARTDVYAAGIMLFEMLTGVQPHTGESPLAVAYKHVSDVVPPPSTLVPGLPAALDALVALATSRDPDLRPSDADQFLHAVTEVRHGTPLSTARRGAHAAPEGSRDGIAGLPAAGPAGSPGPGAGSAGDELPDTDLSMLATGVAGYTPPAAPPAGPADHRSGGYRAEDYGTSGYGADGRRAGSHGGRRSRHGAPDRGTPGEANHTLVVSAGTFVPGFRDAGDDPTGGRRSYGPDHEPPLQRLLFSKRVIWVLGTLAVVLLAVLLGWWLTAGQYSKVPQVSQLSAGLARTELTGLGFKVADGTPVHSNIEHGHIVSTIPRAGAKIRTGGTITFILSLGPVKIAVPQVTGLPVGQAEQDLRGKGLIPGTPVPATSSTVAAGVVISTDPVAGTAWPKNKPVGITVSAGPPLPNFVGGTVTAAQATAAAGGYSIQPVTDAKSDQPSGTVTRQSPAAGAAIRSGEVVTVYVSAGPPEVSVPDVDGMSAGQAVQALQAAGFQVNVDKGFGNHVTGYSPQGQAPKGSTITINVGFVF